MKTLSGTLVTCALLLAPTDPSWALSGPTPQQADVESLVSDEMAGRDNGTFTTVLQVLSLAGGITDPVALEKEINNLPGVLENGLFVNLTDQVLVGEIVDGVAGVRDLVKR